MGTYVIYACHEKQEYIDPGEINDGSIKVHHVDYRVDLGRIILHVLSYKSGSLQWPNVCELADSGEDYEIAKEAYRNVTNEIIGSYNATRGDDSVIEFTPDEFHGIPQSLTEVIDRPSIVSDVRQLVPDLQAAEERRELMELLKGDPIRDPFIDNTVGPKAIFQIAAPAKSGFIDRLWAKHSHDSEMMKVTIVPIPVIEKIPCYILAPTGWIIAGVLVDEKHIQYVMPFEQKRS